MDNAFRYHDEHKSSARSLFLIFVYEVLKGVGDVLIPKILLKFKWQKQFSGGANVQKQRITATQKSPQKTIKYAHKLIEPPKADNRGYSV